MITHKSHSIRYDDDENPFCCLCAAMKPEELAEECLDQDPLDPRYFIFEPDLENQYSKEDEYYDC
jgi:hypothetical protein